MMSSFQQRISVTSPFRRILAEAGFALALLVPMHVEAEESIDLAKTYDRSEIYLLPVYCKYTPIFRERVPGGNNLAEIERLNRSMGEKSFMHMHHYCRGLMASNRASYLSRTPQDRLHNLGISINEFDYVIQRVPPDFALLPEMLTKRGENLTRLNRGEEGMLDFRRAIELKPDYWPAYAAMSDYYKEIGQDAKAREWLKKGLSVAPNTKALMLRLAELDAPKSKHKNNPHPPVER